jgi:hypothetical protein
MQVVESRKDEVLEIERKFFQDARKLGALAEWSGTIACSDRRTGCFQQTYDEHNLDGRRRRRKTKANADF